MKQDARSWPGAAQEKIRCQAVQAVLTGMTQVKAAETFGVTMLPEPPSTPAIYSAVMVRSPSALREALAPVPVMMKANVRLDSGSVTVSALPIALFKDWLKKPKIRCIEIKYSERML